MCIRDSCCTDRELLRTGHVTLGCKVDSVLHHADWFCSIYAAGSIMTTVVIVMTYLFSSFSSVCLQARARVTESLPLYSVLMGLQGNICLLYTSP